MDVKNARGRTVSLLNDDPPRLSSHFNSAATTTTSTNTSYTDHHPPRRPPLHTLPSISSSSFYSASSRSSSSRSPYSGTSSRSNSSLDLPPLRHSSTSDRRDSSSDSTPRSPLTPPATLFGAQSLHRSTNSSYSKKHLSLDAGRPCLSSSGRTSSTPGAPMDPYPWAAGSSPVSYLNDPAFFSLPPVGNPMYGSGTTPSSSSPPSIHHQNSLQHQSQHSLQPALAPLPAPNAFPFQQPSIPEILPNPVESTPNSQQQSFQSGSVTAPKSGSKKSSYPCPVAKQFNCSESFTTSGHAARHAKKHTGKKDAICPECGKGFTRKDNMEQHRRTHSNGRNGSNSNPPSSASKGTPSSSRDSEETKARSKARMQQRKNRPGSISTSVGAPSPQTIQELPSAISTASPDLGNLVVDPALQSPHNLTMLPTDQDLLMAQAMPSALGMAMPNAMMQQQPLPAMQPGLPLMDNTMSPVMAVPGEETMPRLETLALAAATRQ